MNCNNCKNDKNCNGCSGLDALKAAILPDKKEEPLPKEDAFLPKKTVIETNSELKKISTGRTLKDLNIGESAIITHVGGEGFLRQHFLDMGVIPEAEITLVKYAPMGDPAEYRIHGYELTLRLSDAEKIIIGEPYFSEDEEHEIYHAHTHRDASRKELLKESAHPGFGEGGKYHTKSDGEELPKGTLLSFALVGNQNCGKTTLFNQLTGSNQHVGNFPGVTVDRKGGEIKEHPGTEVTDLPGIYSLSPYSDEEIVSRQFILEENPKGIINIVDATNIERNLYLTMQLMELEVPICLALNMMDEVRANGGTINVNKMEDLLGIPVVPISAAKDEGIHELVHHAIHVAKYQEKPGRTDFCSSDKNGGAVHRCIHGIMHLIWDHAEEAGIPVRFAASKLIEGDHLIEESLNLTQNEKETIEHIIVQMEEERGLDRAAAIADMRFVFIFDLCRQCVVKPKESKEHKFSQKLDKILTGKWTSIPLFVAIMALVFYMTFNVIGGNLQILLQMGISALTDLVDHLLTAGNVNVVIHSLIIDGVFNGVGTVLSFVPIIVVLFLFLSLLEDTGYMARVAFVMDKLLRKIGLSGKSVVPMLIGFGCTVPGVMSTRTLSSERDRKMTIMLTPFMSCSAKLPVYAFFASAFFPQCAWLVMVAMYFIGILVGVIVALVSKRTAFKGEAVPFVMELPNYRLPGAKNVLHLMWDKTKDFIKKAFTVILIATIVIWFLQTFDFHLTMVEDSSQSMLAVIAGFISPIFKPFGFGDWRVVTALVSGFMAKESVVSTLSILYGGMQGLILSISPVAAFALLVFCLLYTPCVAAIVSIRKELGVKWSLGIVVGQCLLAYVCAGLVTLIGLIF